MKTSRLYTLAATGNFVILMWFPSFVTAQPAPVPYRIQPYVMDSGLHEGPTGRGAIPELAFSEIIQVADAPWLRLKFQDYHLQQQSRPTGLGIDTSRVESDSIKAISYITITSLEDGGTQRMDANSLPKWNNASAYFNGDAVMIELHVAPEDKGVFIRISEILIGERGTGPGLDKTTTQCGATDDRSSSSDAAVGRIIPAGCTGWIVSNGSHLTAGHCVGPNMDILEFDVPASDADGNINCAHPDDQYPIDANSIVWNDDGLGQEGDDWAVFACNPNSNTGLLPIHAQQTFYRMSRDDNPDNVQVTGYGVDFDPAGAPGGPCVNLPCAGFGDCNSSSQTLQLEAGSYEGEDVQSASDVVIDYRVDTECGNSGSPVSVDGSALAVGIHTNGGCTVAGGENSGTGFENDDLEAAIQDFPGPNVEYADRNHPVPAADEDGTVLRPYDTVTEAVNAVLSGGIVSIVTGAYNESITITTAMTITAPVGIVALGTSFLPKSMPALAGEVAAVVAEAADGLIPAVYSLSPNFPNPFNPATTIRFGLPEAAAARLVVYDLLGREVARLLERTLEAGYHSVVWNGKSAAGAELPSGLYIARLLATPAAGTSPGFIQSIKMVLLK